MDKSSLIQLDDVLASIYKDYTPTRFILDYIKSII